MLLSLLVFCGIAKSYEETTCSAVEYTQQQWFLGILSLWIIAFVLWHCL